MYVEANSDCIQYAAIDVDLQVRDSFKQTIISDTISPDITVEQKVGTDDPTINPIATYTIQSSESVI